MTLILSAWCKERDNRWKYCFLIRWSRFWEIHCLCIHYKISVLDIQPNERVSNRCNALFAYLKIEFQKIFDMYECLNVTNQLGEFSVLPGLLVVSCPLCRAALLMLNMRWLISVEHEWWLQRSQGRFAGEAHLWGVLGRQPGCEGFISPPASFPSCTCAPDAHALSFLSAT